jgi:hypothetical protein
MGHGLVVISLNTVNAVFPDKGDDLVDERRVPAEIAEMVKGFDPEGQGPSVDGPERFEIAVDIAQDRDLQGRFFRHRDAGSFAWGDSLPKKYKHVLHRVSMLGELSDSAFRPRRRRD